MNGAAFALIAMDSVSYGFAASGTSSRARLVAYLLAQELPGGGWDYSGKTADPDQTAMVLQALAPYRTQANVSAAIDRALNVLSGMQKDDGSFDAWGASSSESISQVLVALCALGIDPAKDSRFVRANGAWLVSALMSFRVQTETGLAFGHTNRTANYMATEQAGYALAAYERFLAGQPALYTMTDTTYGTHTCVRYRDTARHWAQPYVCAVTEQGLMNGVGNDCFDPEGTLNRAMLATVLWRASGSPAADGGGTLRPFRGRSRAALCRAWAKTASRRWTASRASSSPLCSGAPPAAPGARRALRPSRMPGRAPTGRARRWRGPWSAAF